MPTFTLRNTVGRNAPNLLINGDMWVTQRIGGGLFTNTTATKAYTLDRWFTMTLSGSPTPAFSAARIADAPTGLRTSYRARRESGNTNTSGGTVRQAIESQFVLPLQGRLVTLSFYAKRGANYSPTSNLLVAQIQTGTGFDQDPSAAYTGAATLASTSVTLTTSWQRFSVSAIVPVGVSEMWVGFTATHTGTAGADDSFYITGVMLTEGSLPNQGFYGSGATADAEFEACRRYFRQLGAAVNNGTPIGITGTGSSTTQVRWTVTQAEGMRTGTGVLASANGNISVIRYDAVFPTVTATGAHPTSNTILVTMTANNSWVSSITTGGVDGALYYISNSGSSYCTVDCEL